MEKKQFEKPWIKFIVIENTDLICTSPGASSSTEDVEEEIFNWDNS